MLSKFLIEFLCFCFALIFCRCRGFCHRTESEPFLFLKCINITKFIISELINTIIQYVENFWRNSSFFISSENDHRYTFYPIYFFFRKDHLRYCSMHEFSYICDGCGMPAGDAYFSGHLVPSHLGLAGADLGGFGGVRENPPRCPKKKFFFLL